MSVFDTVAAMQWGSNQAFRGADQNRLHADRWIQANHPDTEIRYAAKSLRAAARDLVRNNPYAAGAVDAVADNVVGWEGIRPRPQIRTSADEPDRPAIWEIERKWADWGDEHATVDGIECWLETERLIVKSWFTDGEVFIRHHRGFDNPYSYAVELIDPDLLDEDFNERREERGREIVMGVEVDEYGRPLAYHFWKHHPDDMRRRERVRVPASEITHHFIRYRPGQTRGFSGFAPVLTTVEMFDGYTEAELVAARYHASKMGFITNNTPEAIAAYAERLRIQNESGKGDRPRKVKMSPGLVTELIPGQGFEGFDPTHPNQAFDPFMTAIMRGIARGLGMSYLTLTGDVSAANYSSMRAGLLPERDYWRVLQNTTARRIHQPVYRQFLSMGLLTGAIDLPSPIAADYHPVEWRGRRWQWVDPKNDLEAAEKEVALGINSRQRLAADRGLDYETVIDETAEDEAYAEEQGVNVAVTRRTPAGQAVADEPGATPRQNGNAPNGNGASASRLVPYTTKERR